MKLYRVTVKYYLSRSPLREYKHTVAAKDFEDVVAWGSVPTNHHPDAYQSRLTSCEFISSVSIIGEVDETHVTIYP